MKIKPKTQWTTFGEMKVGAIFYLDDSLYIKIKVVGLYLRDDGVFAATNRMHNFLTYLEDSDKVREVQTCKVSDLEFGDLWYYNTELEYCYVKLEGDRSIRLGSAVDCRYDANKDMNVVLLELC